MFALLLLLTAMLAATASAKRALVESCSGCRLNGRPEVKRFIKEDIQHFEPEIKVNWIGGRDPTIIFYDDEDREVERISMLAYSHQGLHDLVREKGYRHKNDPVLEKVANDEM